jgi:hypothetical protein
VFGTAHGHYYLLHLNAIRSAMPHARIVACVRDPYATIASWKAAPDRLAGGDALPGDGARPGRESFPWLTLTRWESFEAVAATRSPAQRRAMWWQLLAELILDQGPAVTIVDHARLLADPEAAVAAAVDGLPVGRRVAVARPRAEPDDTGVLDEEDRQAIRAICSQTAADLGLAE